MDDDNQPLAILSQKKYDVFISFRGEDTRANFTSHLHKALKDGGIETYFDEDKLERGEEISKALLEAIEDSKISIVVFSKDYASSSWCLAELAHIIQCVERNTQIVVPVFYHVEPSDVRKQKGSYAEAFENHNKDHYDDATISKWRDALTTTNVSRWIVSIFSFAERLVKRKDCYDGATINRWRNTLTRAANISGWDVSKFSNEAQVVRDIFDFVREKLRSISPSHHYSKLGFVGIEESIADVKKLLSKSPRIGICGMGGLGKTTLAQIVFNQSRHQYHSHCFFPNVREQYQSHGSHNLKVQFFRELSNEKDLQYGGLDSLKKSLGHKKLLIVLDDVDDLDQYNCLLEHSHSWLNSQSRLIITSRNQQVLRNIIGNDEKMIYNLKGLNTEDALELFCLHAFKRKSPQESEKELSLKFVNYAQGLPLALKVLGSHLFSKNKDLWESLLNKITKVDADEKVTSTLKISFDGLSSKQQSIFLDIACFFRGKTKYLVRDILDDCGDSNIAIEVLIDRCLVTVSDEGTLEMHDLLAEMGRSIARGSNNKFLENCSTRLCMGKDVCRFFSSNKASSTIEAISYDHHDGDVINLDPSFFKKLPSLRLLNISSFIGFRSPYALRDPFPGELRFLEWNGYRLESLGSNFTPQNIVYLSMKRSQLWKLWEENQDVSNLKYVILSESKKLTCLPNLSQGNLHMLRLDGCTSLVTLPPLRFHDILDDPDKEFEVMHIYNSLTVKYINEVTIYLLYEMMDYAKISYWVVRKLSTKLLDLNGCSNLTTLSEISGNVKFIRLSKTAIKELHPSIFSLKNLLVLDLQGCKHLRELPNSICELESLEYLDLGGCVSFDKFPRLPKSIKGLDLSGTLIQQVDSSLFDCLPSVNVLFMQACKKLESLPATICKLKSLQVLNLKDCSQLKSFPEISEPMEKLEKLYLNRSGIEVLPSSIENLVMLNNLNLSECKNLKSIPTNIFDMRNISEIEIDEYPQLQILPYNGLPYICSSCTYSTAILNLHYDGVDFTCCQCFLFYTIRNILAAQYFMDEIFIGKCRDERGKDLIEAITPSSLHSGDSIDQSIKSILPYLNFLEDYDKYCRDEKEKDLSEAIRTSFCYSGYTITQWFDHQSMGSSLELNLPFPSLEDLPNFLGFALCIVVDFEATTLKRDDVLKCEYNLKTKTRQNLQSYSTLLCQKATHFDDDDDDSNYLDSSSNHQVFVWYLYRKDISMKRYNFSWQHRPYYDILLGEEESGIFEFHISKGTIKQCGVHLLHRQYSD
ncbi:hypothetical protein CsatA_005647 [Cannabis sativa]